ncbi:MAG TPA: insulinase family protein, partial [Vicinamibacterales bacterium]|nr:insulinase family protein [Vicinamibacterales bacterium]
MTGLRRSVLAVFVGSALVLGAWPAVSARQVNAPAPAQASAGARVTELDVNGLKVLVKERPGTQTIAAGLYIRGGSRNVTATDAGIESLMLSVATEASANYPREKFRRELSRTGTVIGSGVNHDYSAFTLGCTREHFDEAWAIFADAAMHPSFDPADFDRVKGQHLLALQSQRDTPDAALEAEVERV